MAITYVDTDQLSLLVSDINALIQDYNMEINRLFTTFSNVPTVTKEWVGNSAEDYFSGVMLEKSDFIAFGNRLYKYTKYLNNICSSVHNSVDKCQRIEEDSFQ